MLIAAAFAGLRRAVELDRYGIAAHVLATRDGCTAEQCAAFALLDDTDALKANLKAQAFDQYVSRYAARLEQAPSPDRRPVGPAAARAPRRSPACVARAPAKTPLSGKYDFPSAASIPPVSIMNAEPPLPKARLPSRRPTPKPRASRQAEPARRRQNVRRAQAAPAGAPR